ncbi:pyrophosphatase PpaX [Desulfonispora thiosulfatigenes DSM 11270]|uniref:Pyrophosphatase PpaX n=1 Tax=Desulfonispora thiosulfatigenes DSM 11270 TaxID=656914 RepID=A0A1W1VGR5_DESTI|nr:pyrophosphatase PpaX [Desulfonispora thiosulfatigenes]SMB92565.1 pyrophosphatase PpaX [Desulfonispora thiosulfatigenes DSM 11270]
MIKGILFDLDGTLLYTNDLVIKSFQYTFKKILNMDLTRAELVPYFGEPLVDTFARYSEDKVDTLLTTYRKYNHEYHDYLTTIFPGVKQGLHELKDQGYLLGVVTSKINTVAQRGLDLFDISPYFDTFIGANDTTKHKPNPDPIFKALDNLNLNPEEALMVGDTSFDILCGKNAGVKTAVMKYSEHPLDKLSQYNPDLFLDSILDLANIFKENKKRA